MAQSDWSDAEIAHITRDYLEMLTLELSGKDYVKADYRRNLLPFLNGRTGGSVEFKHQNISAILCENNLPFVVGYKPRFNYQEALRTTVLTQMNAHEALLAVIARKAEQFPEMLPSFVDLPSLRRVVVPAPPLPTPQTVKREQTRHSSPIVREPVVTKIDYVAQEARNRTLGRLGEEFVYRYEQAKLATAGFAKMAKTVEWVSQTQGDGLGYDIASFDLQQQPLFIEVKTTNLSALHPFFVTERELSVSRTLGPCYRLYRLHDFSQSPRFFEISGNLAAHLRLDPMIYRASIAR
jgi:hypothetical protein